MFLETLHRAGACDVHLPAQGPGGTWVAQAWPASLQGYIPQQVEAQIKPLCIMSIVPAELLWDFSAVLAYVRHLESKWNRNGNYPAAHGSEPLAPRLLPQLQRLALRNKKAILCLFPQAFKDSANHSPFMAQLVW